MLIFVVSEARKTRGDVCFFSGGWVSLLVCLFSFAQNKKDKQNKKGGGGRTSTIVFGCLLALKGRPVPLLLKAFLKKVHPPT